MTARHELVLELILDCKPQNLYRCWTEPELIKQTFAPKPWTTPSAKVDVRPGGGNEIVMRSPEGQDSPNKGQYLEVVPGRKLVFTDAFTGDWVPSENPPFFTAVLTFEDAPGGKTKYTARARHWTAEAMQQHEQMGFIPGWTICAKQMEEVARTL